MKVIFLDIDGVLNSAQFCAKIKDKRLTMQKIEREIDKKPLLMLKRIVNETGARIVVTSSMRKEPTFKDFKEYVSHEGIRIHDVTLDFGDSGMHRGEEIREWIQKHKEELEEYVILDDYTFKDFGEELKAHQVKSNMWTTRGLEQIYAEQAITLLGKLNVGPSIARTSFEEPTLAI